MTTHEARTALRLADVFFDADENAPEFNQAINLNDVWGWAAADSEPVPDECLVEVAGWMHRYGWPGILYWVHRRRGGCWSQFADINRYIQFVAQEEKIRAETDDSSLAYRKVTYMIGADP